MLAKRRKRAVEQSATSQEYLRHLEATIDEVQLKEWRRVEKEWEENVLHVEESDAFECPYELRKEKGMSVAATLRTSR